MPGNDLGLVLPTVGDTVGPDYATAINLAIQTIADDVEAKITPDEITINADLSFTSFGTPYGATGLKRTAFNSQSAVLDAGSLNSAYVLNGELYFQDGSGNDVQVTTGGNVSGAAGNISTSGSPAYAASGVEILWSGGDLEYRMKSGSAATDFADVLLAAVEFRQSTFTMKMSSLVAADYNIIWPAAGPAAGDLMQLDASGNISFVKTLTGALTLSALLTANAGITLAANTDVTLSGTGTVRHGSKTLFIPAAAFVGVGDLNLTLHKWTIDTASSRAECPILLPAGKRITNIDIHMDGANANSKSAAFASIDSTGTVTAIDSDTDSNSGNITISLAGLTTTLAAGSGYFVYVTSASGSVADSIFGVEVTYDE